MAGTKTIRVTGKGKIVPVKSPAPLFPVSNEV